MSFLKKRPRLPAFLSALRYPVAAIAFLSAAVAFAGAPTWWNERGVLVPNGTKNDYGPANAGQFKNIATKARDELNANLPGGAGQDVEAMVMSFSGTNNYAPVNLGQLKAVAKPFYDRLISIGYTDYYPWTITKGEVNFQPANIGQVKNVFSFDLTSTDAAHDTDGNGLPDWWERLYFNGHIGVDPNADDDGDGWTNLEEWRAHTNPKDAQSIPDLPSPTNFAATVNADGSVELTWTDNPNNHIGYFIQRKRGDGTWYRIGWVLPHVQHFHMEN